jgi:plasmid stabilization system protein ParE
MTPAWSAPASRVLQELTSYIAQDTPHNADLIRARILKSVQLLATMPYAGRPERIPGTRELIPVPPLYPRLSD